MIGKTLKHYKILERIGKGGMGEVYSAEDTRLKRKVALKILPEELARDPFRAERFQREAESIAALNHPNIVTIHSLEEVDGIYFLAMELVEGSTLGALIPADGMDLTMFLHFAIPISEALTAAHEKRIVHRDLKPANIMVANGRVKILDFGLAKLLRDDPDSMNSGNSQIDTYVHTEAGIVMGTLPYMSPEQVQGKKLDSRTDIFSLGIIFYEMITGRRPFSGNSAAEIVSSLLRDTPDPLRASKNNLPVELARIIGRCLMKNPNDRYQTAHEILTDLRDLITASQTKKKARIHHLSSFLTRFVGRERELAELMQLVSGARLVTITGVGGAGKTRLALEVASRCAEDFPDGICQVNLAPVASEDVVVNAVSAALDVQETPVGSLLDSVIAVLRDSNLLLVMDSCEHVLDEAARVIDAILHAAPNVRVLATSRESLNLDGENVWRVPPLSIPAQTHSIAVEDAKSFDSIKLFIDRATASDPAFRLTSSNLDSVVNICRRLDGIPLAIELAAVRIKTMSASEIYKRLDDCFKLLSSGSRAGLQRHQTLRAAVDWSYDLLSEDEQILFRRLACFSGGFDLEAAESVCGGGADVLESITRLVDKSLVLSERDEKDDVRYRLLEPLRQYAQEKLNQSPDHDLARRHYEYFVSLAERAYQERIELSTYWLERLEKEHDNLYAAWKWASQNAEDVGLQLAGALSWFWQLHSHFSEGRRILRQVLDENQKRTFHTARALCGASILAIHQGEHQEGRRFADESISIWRELGDTKELALALENIGWAAWFGGDHKAAYSAFEETVQIYRRLGNNRLINRAILNICQVLVSDGKVDETEPLAQKALDAAIESNETRDVHNALHYLADCALIRGDVASAEKKYAASLQAAMDYGDRFEMVFEVEGVAMALAGQGRHAKAFRLAAASNAEREVLKANIYIHFWEALKERYLKAAEAKAGRQEVEKEKQIGKKMGFDKAMQYALDLNQD